MSVATVVNSILSNPISLAIISGLIGIITFAYQARKKHVDEQTERKRLLYESLIENVFKLLSAKPGIERSLVLTEIEKSWLFASEEVLIACYAVLSVYDDDSGSKYDLAKSIHDDQHARLQFENAVAELFCAMREDLRGTNSGITVDWAKSVVRVYDSGAPAEIN